MSRAIKLITVRMNVGPDVDHVVDKAAEILSSVCQMARERKDASNQPGIKSLTPAPDVPAPLSTTSTLRATVTGKSLTLSRQL